MTSASVRGIGVADMTSVSGRVPLAARSARCSTPKRCCSSITTRPSRAKARALREERVGPDHQARPAGGDPLARLALQRRGQTGRQQLDALPRRRQQALEGAGVLLREDLGRRHQRRLPAVLGRRHHRQRRDDRLPRADVAHQQAVHRPRRAQVLLDLRHDPPLRPRQLEGEQRGEPRAERVVDRVSAAAALRPAPEAAQREPQLEQEELLEGQATVAGGPGLGQLGGAGPGGRAVDRAQRLEPAGEAVGREQGRRKRVRGLFERGQREAGRRAHPLRRQRPDLLVDRAASPARRRDPRPAARGRSRASGARPCARSAAACRARRAGCRASSTGRGSRG